MQTKIKLLALLSCMGWQFGLQAQDTVRVMTYNLLNYPSSSSVAYKNEQIATIVQYAQPDVFVINELNENPAYIDSILNGALNINGVSNWAHAAYSCTTGAGLCNMLFYNNDKFGLKAQYAIPFPALREMNRYELYYRSPDLALTHDTIYMHVVSVHLKSSSGGTNESTRNQMATTVMDHLTSSGVLPNSNVLLMGDFNLYGSYEAAYKTFTENTLQPTLKFNDLLPLGGNLIWNNAAYAPYHTQSTRVTSLTDGGAGGGMDDRFDMMFFSDKVLSGADSVQVIANSYRAIGQDGNRYNGSVNSPVNNSVPAEVAQALYNNSDHLPVMSQLKINFLPPLQAQIVSPTSPTTICNNQTVTLQAYTAPGYTYQWLLNGVPINGATSASYNTNQAGNYNVQIDYFGYKALSQAVVLDATPLPTPIISGEPLVCWANTFTYLVATTAGHTYEWSVSPNGTIVSGQGTNMLTVIWNSGVEGSVSVVEIGN